ncbi:S-layer homology domain-containing protein [Gorillibacterium sp. sgz500922]|uniref:S-layer homology domain-containing protein n=1 Tax=Gorillibacterium sp. sgz500922 TaxID=3446694 RepID=UPI003F67EFCE
MKRTIHWTAKTALTLAVLTGSVMPASVFADPAAIAASWKIQAANTFSDVKSTYWGAKDIAKLSMLGVVQGYNGSFTPEKEVSHQDSLVMAIRMLGYNEEALENNRTSLTFTFGVSDYAKGYVKAALDHHLISLSEIPEQDSKWGPSAASREWVARIIIRMADKEAEATAKMLAPTAFKDGDSISDELVGYVNEAVDLGIVNGFEDGSFRPAVAVTRSQAAAMLNRTSAYLDVKPGNAVSGTITAIDSKGLTIMTDSGAAVQAAFTSQSLIYKNSSAIAATALKAGNLVEVIASGSTAYFVEWKSDQGPVVSGGDGTAVSLNATDKTLTMVTSAGQGTYTLTDTAYEAIKALVGGDKIRYQLYGTKVVSASIVPVVKGSIVEIVKTGEEPYILLKKADGQPATFFLKNAQPTVTSPLKPNAYLSDLLKGDQVAIELDSAGKPVSISIVISSMTNYYLATIVNFSSSPAPFLTVVVNGKGQVFKLDENSSWVDANGVEMKYGTATANVFTVMLGQSGRELDLVTAGDKLLKVKMSSKYTGTVTTVDLNTGAYSVKLDDGQILNFTWKVGVKVLDPASKAVNFDQVTVGRKVTLTYEQSNDQVSQIQLVN